MKKSKRIIVFLVLLSFVANQLIVTNATSTQNSVEESITNVDNQKEDIEQRISIGILNYLSMKVFDAAENNNIYELIRINDIKDKINIKAFKNKTISDFYSGTFDPKITELKGNNIMWDRIKEVYSEKKAGAVRSAIRTAGEGLQNANVDSSVGMVTSAIGTITTTAVAYLDAKAEAESYLKDETAKSEVNEMSIVDEIKRELFKTLTVVGNEYDTEDNLLMRDADINGYISAKNLSQVDTRIKTMEGLEKYAKGYPTYYLDIATAYFERAVRDKSTEDYNKCIDTIHKYEENGGLIFRERADVDYLRAIPYLVTSFKYAKNKTEYVAEADKYLSILAERLAKTDVGNWDLAYYIEIMYEDLYKSTGDKKYLKKGYDVALDFVGPLSEKQREYNKQNSNYVMDSLLYNINNLFKYAKNLNISQSEKKTIENIIHNNGKERLFPVYPLDNYFWFNIPTSFKNMEDLSDNLNLDYDDLKLMFSILNPAFKFPDQASKENIDEVNNTFYRELNLSSKDMQFIHADGNQPLTLYVNKNLIDRNRSTIHLKRDYNGEPYGEYDGEGYCFYMFRDNNSSEQVTIQDVEYEKLEVSVFNDYSDLGIVIPEIKNTYNANVLEEEVENKGFFGIGKKTDVIKQISFERVN